MKNPRNSWVILNFDVRFFGYSTMGERKSMKKLPPTEKARAFTCSNTPFDRMRGYAGYYKCGLIKNCVREGNVGCGSTKDSLRY